MIEKQDTQFADMGGEERYDYFLDVVSAEREIWILVNADDRFLKIVAEDGGAAYLPVWPSQESAETYAAEPGELTPRAVSLSDFFRKWVPGLTRDNLEVGVFPRSGDELWITPAEELKRELHEVMSAAF